MTRLLLRNLLFYWRTNAAVVAGVAAAVAVLAGALIVGQSVRASLRDLLNERLGATDYVVSADRFFRQELAGDFAAEHPAGSLRASCPIIAVKGSLTREGTTREAYDVNVYGVDERFFRFHGLPSPAAFEDQAAIVGAPLAAHLGVNAGDRLLLRVGNREDIPGESLYGRRDAAATTIRLTCSAVAGSNRLGEFSLRPGQGSVFSLFVPLSRLQRAVRQPDGANTILISSASRDDRLPLLKRLLRDHLTSSDVGVRFRAVAGGQGVAVESARILVDDAIARAAFEAAGRAGRPASGVFAYLANAIRTRAPDLKVGPTGVARGREIPYSVIAAVDLGQGAMGDVRLVTGSPMPGPTVDAHDSIWFNEWAWRDLGIAIGDPVDVDYYHWVEGAGLVTRTARFNLRGVVAIGGDVDDTLAPEVPGISDARSLRAWDPPFPIDLGRIRSKDEDYWERYRGTPKAFVTLSTGQTLWENRFGRLTAVRIGLPQSAVAETLTRAIDPETTGFTIAAVRRDGLDASRGAVDLGEYFLYFSAFLIAAAVLLSASFFKLGVEQRVREIGTLRAVGFPASTLRGIFLAEAAILLGIGGVVGAAGSLVYGGVLVAGLRTWWIGAVGTERVSMHASWGPIMTGLGVTAVVSFAAIAWSLRGLARRSPRALLAGVLESRTARTGRARVLTAVAGGSLAGAMLVLAASARGTIASVEGFFGAGTLLLVSTLSLTALVLRRAHPRPIGGRGWRALGRLAFRGAAHRPARSLLPVALIASATFIIVSVDAFRKDSRGDQNDRLSGTGGYSLVATSVLPVLSDPSTGSGREALGLGAAEAPELADVQFVSFRQRAGDDASCLNLYAPGEPAVLGAPPALVTERRFSFSASLASTDEERQNPWRLLDTDAGSGVIPAIADANSLEYSLHLPVGGETTIRDGRGSRVRVKIVAALRDSILQGALIVSEASFLRMFPAEEGYRFFLLDVPSARGSAVSDALTDRLGDAGLRVQSSRERLAAYHKVENTYLSTFQSLGTLGLVLGTIGLLAVLLRNVLERRAELALLRAVGYRQATLAAMVIAEHVLLIVCGLACGTVSALVAILPALAARGGVVPVTMVALLLVGVTAAALISSLLGGVAALRSPLVIALRSE